MSRLNLSTAYTGITKLRDFWSIVKTNFTSIVIGHNDLEDRVDNIVAGAGNSNTEIVDARQSAAKSKTFSTLDARLEEAEQDYKTHFNDYVSHAELSARTIYVDLTNGNDTSGTGLSGAPYKTINKALSTIKRYLAANITITVLAGDNSENVSIVGFHGFGSLNIVGGGALSNTYVINTVTIDSCLCNVSIQGVSIKNSTYVGISITKSFNVTLNYIKISTTASFAAIMTSNSNVIVSNCQIDNRAEGIRANALSNIQSVTCTGSGNTNVLVANGSVIRKYGSQPGGTTAETTIAGGQIL